METQALWRQVLGIKYKYPSSSCAIDFQLIKVGGPGKNICSSLLHNELISLMVHSSIRMKVGNDD